MAFSSLVSGLAEDEHPIYRSYYKSQVLPLLEHSPLLRRAHTKPLGYAGDYEMVNMMFRKERSGRTTYAQIVNDWLLNGGPPQA